MALYKLDEVWHDDTDNSLWRRIKGGFAELLTTIRSSLTTALLTVTSRVFVGNYPEAVTVSTGDIFASDGTTSYVRMYPAGPGFYVRRAQNNASGSNLVFYKSRGTLGTAGRTAITTGDDLGLIRAYGHDGSTDIEAARITFDSFGTVASNRVAGIIRFYAHPDSTSALNEIVSIDDTGMIINTNKALTVNGIRFPSTYEVGNNIIACLPTRIYGRTATSYAVATGTWTAQRNGTVRVKFSVVRRASSGTGYGQIYKNGSAVAGTEITNTNAGTWTNGSFDVPVSIGDTIEIWTKSSSTSYNNGNIGNARICTDDIVENPPIQNFVIDPYVTTALAIPPLDLNQTIRCSIKNSAVVTVNINNPATTGTYHYNSTASSGLAAQGSTILTISSELHLVIVTRIV